MQQGVRLAFCYVFSELIVLLFACWCCDIVACCVVVYRGYPGRVYAVNAAELDETDADETDSLSLLDDADAEQIMPDEFETAQWGNSCVCGQARSPAALGHDFVFSYMQFCMLVHLLHIRRSWFWMGLPQMGSGTTFWLGQQMG